MTDEECRLLGKALSIAVRGEVWKLAVDATWLMIITGWCGEVLGLDVGGRFGTPHGVTCRQPDRRLDAALVPRSLR